MILTNEQVRQVFYQAGFRGNDLEKIVSIVECESGNNTDANNVTSREDSRGLAQINILAWSQFAGIDLYDPYQNAVAAYSIYKSRNKSFQDWSCANILGLLPNSPIMLYIGVAFLVYFLLN